jgi:hypothetical protein
MTAAPEPDEPRPLPPLTSRLVLPVTLLCLAVSGVYLAAAASNLESPAGTLTPEDNAMLNNVSEALDTYPDALVPEDPAYNDAVNFPGNTTD